MAISKYEYTQRLSDAFYNSKGVGFRDDVLHFGDYSVVLATHVNIYNPQMWEDINQKELLALAKQGLVKFSAKVWLIRTQPLISAVRSDEAKCDGLIFKDVNTFLQTPAFDDMVRTAANSVDDQWLQTAVALWYARRLGVRHGTIEQDEADIPQQAKERHRDVGVRGYSGAAGTGYSEVRYDSSGE